MGYAKHPCEQIGHVDGFSKGHIDAYGCTRIRLRWGPLQFKSMPLVPGQGLYRRYLLLKHGRG